ncbi:MAG: glycosyltransferase [Actinomycetota bacterium]|nr:glycosyltransferase [Actinomycetota bacterium]
MKILYLTAYYPPDFASGATLQVQRVAEQAVGAGHDVRVFSGASRKGLADGDIAVEDVGGVTVHWIGSTGWVPPADDANWWNPVAADAVAHLLDEFTPDIVHAHTLQTLGGSTVEAALDRGIRTVVTMHDHWWWCALLFLVGNDLKPCTPVTDAGNCVCAKDQAWRTARAAALRRVLDRVEEVLVPSTMMRDLVVANGVDPARVSVDANDVAVAVKPAVNERTATDGPVRFIYFGGDHGVKGVDVLLNAATMLRRGRRWTLDMYGVAERQHLVSSPVAFRPAFEPAAVTRVLSGADVMVLPSIARESFSIAVRESLAAGLVVITSDCYGPEEVVHDGVNGIVVPAGDADALASAMARLIDDAALLRRLRAAVAEQQVDLRSPGEHAAALLARYSATRPVPRRSPPTRVGYLVDSRTPGVRFRADHGAEALELHGVTTSVVEAGTGTARLYGADVVIMQDAVATAPLLATLAELRAAGTELIYDASDATFEPAPGADPLAGRRLETIVACDRAIGATADVAARITALTGLASAVVPNAVGIAEVRLADEALRQRVRPLLPRGPLLVAVVRSDESWHEAEPLVAALLEEHRRWRMLILGDIGARRGLDRLGRRVRHETLHDWRSLPSRLVGADVVLAPFGASGLAGADAARTIAWLEASLVGVPVVAMATSGSEQVIEHRRTGLIADDDARWASLVESLATDPDRRRRIGHAARRQVLLHHGPHSTAHRLLDTLSAGSR